DPTFLGTVDVVARKSASQDSVRTGEPPTQRLCETLGRLGEADLCIVRFLATLPRQEQRQGRVHGLLRSRQVGNHGSWQVWRLQQAQMGLIGEIVTGDLLVGGRVTDNR